MRIDIWSDVVCPWCYVGKRRLETALADFPHADQVEVVWHSFELDPSAPQHGHELTTPMLARKYGRSEGEMRQMQQQLIDVAAEEGLVFRLFENVHTKTIDAHRLLHLAHEAGRQDVLKEALLAAYFVEARNVGDHDVLREVAVSAGLDPTRVDEVLASDEYAADVRADIEQARAYGATGVPFYVVDQKYGISGAQPTELFAKVLDQAWAERQPPLQVVPAGGSGEVCGPDGCAT